MFVPYFVFVFFVYDALKVFAEILMLWFLCVAFVRFYKLVVICYWQCFLLAKIEKPEHFAASFFDLTKKKTGYLGIQMLYQR